MIPFEQPAISDKVFRVRALGDFLTARIFRVGFRTKDEFIEATGKSRQAIFNLLSRREPPPASVHRATLELVARSLKFNEWAEVIRAWKTDDLSFGLVGEDQAGAPSQESMRITSKPGPFDHAVFIGYGSDDLTVLGRRVLEELLRRHPGYPDAKRILKKADEFLESMGDGLRQRKHA